MTVINETWPSNGTTISSGQDLVWTETAQDLTVVANHLETAATNTQADARAESDLAGADHYAQSGMTFDAIHHEGVVQSIVWARFDSAAENAYGVNLYTLNGGTTYFIRLSAMTSGTNAFLSGDAGIDVTANITPGTPNTVRIEVTGTSPNITVKSYLDGVLKKTVTGESTIAAANVRTGVTIFMDTTAAFTNRITLDNFEAGDLGSTPPTLGSHGRPNIFRPRLRKY